jgi:hypothetical protein
MNLNPEDFVIWWELRRSPGLPSVLRQVGAQQRPLDPGRCNDQGGPRKACCGSRVQPSHGPARARALPGLRTRCADTSSTMSLPCKRTSDSHFIGRKSLL